MAEGVASGLVRPSRDEEARLRYLTYQTMGALLVQFVTTPGADARGVRRLARAPGSRTPSCRPSSCSPRACSPIAQMLDDYLRVLGTADPAAPITAPPTVRRPPAASRP